MRMAIVVFIALAAAEPSIGAGTVGAYQLTALGLDSRRPIEWNLTAISSRGELVEGIWFGNAGEFEVLLSGALAAPPNSINVSTQSPHSRSDIENIFNLDAAQGLVAPCPKDLLADDGIGCEAVFYDCQSSTKRCTVMVLTYSRKETPEYSAIHWVDLKWSLLGFMAPAPNSDVKRGSRRSLP
ncbi:hypothetical protein ABIB57_004652 [Devosia sp. UYZn731]|uniref:hypothetical protein n=1 Tax=Devosia sp. UYZn731 TaxID=3156345 RepID=UPI00339432EF